jgi:acetate kinase
MKILTINGGSSSLKFALFDAAERPVRLLSGRVERVGREGSWLVVNDGQGARMVDRAVGAPDQTAAAGLVVREIEQHAGLGTIAAAGHRVVHGGSRFLDPALVDAEMLEQLGRLSPFDPEHLPGEVALIEALARALPGVPQVACFDTAFHRTLPRVAQIVPVPRKFWALGVRRYGFHGLSYTYLLEELGRSGVPGESSGRVVLAHLGAGASLAAVRKGHCLETTMGFTPAAGVVMSTRTGDIDPGIVAFLAHAVGMSPDQFLQMANHESGLLGVSETSGDVRDLLGRRESDERAAEAIALFAYRIKTTVGALTAALGGLDTLVFSGGIGENSAEIRRDVCAGLEYFGIALDERRNAAGEPLISADASRVRVRVIPTDEEIVIAREAIRLGARAARAGMTPN